MAGLVLFLGLYAGVSVLLVGLGKYDSMPGWYQLSAGLSFMALFGIFSHARRNRLDHVRRRRERSDSTSDSR